MTGKSLTPFDEQHLSATNIHAKNAVGLISNGILLTHGTLSCIIKSTMQKAAKIRKKISSPFALFATMMYIVVKNNLKRRGV